MLVYLAGCMSFYDLMDMLYKAKTWRKTAQEKLEDIGYEVFNPMINYERNKEIAEKDSKIIVNQNLTYLKKTDIILVNLDFLRESSGTLFELFYAYLNNIPVVAFGYNPIIKKPHVKECITYHTHTLDDAIDVICSMFGVIV